jgi:hypothetical protein
MRERGRQSSCRSNSARQKFIIISRVRDDAQLHIIFCCCAPALECALDGNKAVRPVCSNLGLRVSPPLGAEVPREGTCVGAQKGANNAPGSKVVQIRHHSNFKFNAMKFVVDNCVGMGFLLTVFKAKL